MRTREDWGVIRKRVTGLLCAGILCMTTTAEALLPAQSAKAAAPYVIVLDPGHDSTHSRSFGSPSGIVEEDFTLEMAKACGQELEARGFTVYLTRNDEKCPVKGTEISNDQCQTWRTTYAAAKGCDLYVNMSLDVSGSRDGQYHSDSGSTVYISSYKGYEKSLEKLAAGTSTALWRECGIPMRIPGAVKLKAADNPGYNDETMSDYSNVIRNCTYNGVPAIQIVHGYMDSMVDARLLKQAGAAALGRADAKAIIDWYQEGKRMEKTSAPAKINRASGYVNYTFLNVCSAPGTGSCQVARLSQNDTVYILANQGNWYKVLALHGNAYCQGYVEQGYITLHKETRYPEGDPYTEPEETPEESSEESESTDESAAESSDESGAESTDESAAESSGESAAESSGESTESSAESSAAESSAESGSDFHANAYVDFAYLNLRSGASTSSRQVAKLDRNDPLEILATKGDWYQVRAKHGGEILTGYVFAKYVTKNSSAGSSSAETTQASTSAAQSSAATGYVNFRYLNVRRSPSTSSQKIAELHANDQVTILDASNGWYHIRCTVDGSTIEGYVSQRYISR